MALAASSHGSYSAQKLSWLSYSKLFVGLEKGSAVRHRSLLQEAAQ
jgi:hypothetical protein